MHYSKGHVLLKNSILFLLVMITFASTMNSCTVHKRVHRKGWFVQWHHNKSSGVATQEDHDSAVAQKDIQNDAPQPLVANKNPETSAGKSIPTDEVVVETKALEPTNPSEQVSDPIEEEPKDGKVETEEKVWHSTLPISIALVGAISFAVVLSIFGLIFILVPIALTTLIGLGTFMEIREIKFKQKDKPPKRQIWIMTALIEVIWIASLPVILGASNIVILGMTALLFVAFVVFLNWQHRKGKSTSAKRDFSHNSNDSNESASEQKESTMDPVEVEQNSTTDESSSDYTGILVFGIMCLVLAGLAFLIGLVFAFLGSLTVGFFIPEIILLAIAALVVLGVVLIAIYIDKITSQRKVNSKNEEVVASTEEKPNPNKKKTDLVMAIYMTVLIVGIALLILL